MTLQQKREQIKMALEAGFRVKAENIADLGDSDILHAYFKADMYELKGLNDVYSLGDITEDTTFEILPRIVPNLEVGDKVKVAYVRSGQQWTVGKTGTVIETDATRITNVRVEDVNGATDWFPAEWLCPVVEEDDGEETNELKERLAAAEAEIADIKQRLNEGR